MKNIIKSLKNPSINNNQDEKVTVLFKGHKIIVPSGNVSGPDFEGFIT